MSFENSFKIVSELVDDFKANEKHYLSHNYSEADVRNDFINKFFTALGWDVTHDIQKNPYEQEVRVEKPLQIAKAQKRADYSFALAPNYRIVKFFIEAKKQLQQAKTEGDKNYLNRKCERLDKEIDQLVYQLYGLTEEEIKIVEGGN